MQDIKDFKDVLEIIMKYGEILLLRKYLYGLEVTIFFTALVAANKVRSLQSNQKFYWLKSLFLVVVTGFGGGMTAPILIGRPPIFMTNDLIIPCCILAWYMTHYLGFQRLITWMPVHLICVFFAMIFKTHAICNTINFAHKAIPTSPYYSISLTGPIIAGTVNGMMGIFYPLDKGLNPISNGTPWVIQGAIISSVFYHLMVNDTQGILGTTLRAYVGEYPEDQVRIMIACLWISCQSIQSIFGPSYNPLQPLYKIFYFISQVEEPIPEKKSISLPSSSSSSSSPSLPSHSTTKPSTSTPPPTLVTSTNKDQQEGKQKKIKKNKEKKN